VTPVAEVSAFFTSESVLIFQGSTLIVLVVANTVGFVTGERFYYVRKWVALAVAFGLQAIVVLAIQPGRSEWLVACLNALLVFAAAVGLNEATYALASRYAADARFEGVDKRIFASWLRPSTRWVWGPGR
jgi:hypothetical protein